MRLSHISVTAFLLYRKYIATLKCESRASYRAKSPGAGCALGAVVCGCKSNRASARECAKAHSFSITGNSDEFSVTQKALRAGTFGLPYSDHPQKQKKYFCENCNPVP